MRAVLALLLGLASLSVSAQAADKYPAKPVHWVVGFAAGGPNDIVARIMGEWLSNHLGQQFVIENRVSSGGMIAADAVINSQADGYTVMFVAPNNAIGATLYKNLPFVFLRDTVPVAGMMRLTNVMVVPPSLPVKSVAEFIAYARPIRASSATRPPATARRSICRRSCSSRWRGSTWYTCRIAAQRRRIPT
jgi:tripartite-type tricarboxylate transporter receptor subunit TctC